MHYLPLPLDGILGVFIEPFPDGLGAFDGAFVGAFVGGASVGGDIFLTQPRPAAHEAQQFAAMFGFASQYAVLWYSNFETFLFLQSQSHPCSPATFFKLNVYPSVSSQVTTGALVGDLVPRVGAEVGAEVIVGTEDTVGAELGAEVGVEVGSGVVTTDEHTSQVSAHAVSCCSGMQYKA